MKPGPDRTVYVRDPRVMPRPGDTVARGKVIRRVVRFQWSPFAQQWFVNYKTSNGHGSGSLATWQRWASRAEDPRVAA